MSKYVYERPKGVLIKVCVKEWNKVFANRGRWPFVTANVYLQGDEATVEFLPSKVGIVAFTLSLPILYIVGILEQGMGDTNRDIKGVYFAKKVGSFSSEKVYKVRGNKHSSEWDKLLTLLGKEV